MDTQNITYNDNNEQYIEKCTIHNEEYTSICECDKMYCKICDDLCGKQHQLYTIGYFKKHVILQMENFRDKLNTKIKGLLCIVDIITNEVNKSSII